MKVLLIEPAKLKYLSDASYSFCSQYKANNPLANFSVAGAKKRTEDSSARFVL